MKACGTTECWRISSSTPKRCRMRAEFGGIWIPAPTCPPLHASAPAPSSLNNRRRKRRHFAELCGFLADGDVMACLADGYGCGEPAQASANHDHMQRVCLSLKGGHGVTVECGLRRAANCLWGGKEGMQDYCCCNCIWVAGKHISFHGGAVGWLYICICVFCL